MPQIFLQLLSQVSGLGDTVAGRGHWTLATALYQAVRVLCQGGTIATNKIGRHNNSTASLDQDLAAEKRGERQPCILG